MTERVRCLRCWRPESVCICPHVPRLPTKTHVLILQHPRERDVAIGTARMAHLALPGSELRVGVDFSADPAVDAALRGPALLLFPGRSARDLDEIVTTRAADAPLTLVVLDGTWANARKLLSRNPRLAALPQVRFTPLRPGEYRIRREPAPHCVATIEALAHVLGRLEGDPERFEALLVPFRAMVETQLRHQALSLGRTGKRAPKRPPALDVLAAARDRVVCVHGEANAFPAETRDAPPPCIVQWLAVRPSTGDRFSAVLAPRGPLAEGTARNVGISADELHAGEALPSFAARFAAFLGDDPLVVTWRTYACDVLDAELPGLLPARRLDVRPLASQLGRGPTGSLADLVRRVELTPAEPWAPGRGGRRITDLEAVVRWLGDGVR